MGDSEQSDPFEDVSAHWRDWTRWHLKVPFNPNFYDSVKLEQDSTDSIKLCIDLIYSRIFLAFNDIQVVLLVLKEMEASSITSGWCLRTPSHNHVHTRFPVCVETGVWGIVAPWSTFVSSRHKVSFLVLLASKLTAVDETDTCIFAEVRMDCLFFLVVKLLLKTGIGLELKRQWGEPHKLKWTM